MNTETLITEAPKARASNKIRKFHFVNSTKLWGGEERFVFDLATGLKELGHSAVVYGRTGTEFLSRLATAGVDARPVYPKFDYDFLSLGKFRPSSKDEVFVAITPRDFKLLRMLVFFHPTAKFFWHLGVAYPRPNWEYRRLFKNERLRLLTPSDYLKSRVLSDFPSLEKRISILPNGVDAPSVDADEARHRLAVQYGRPPGQLFLGVFSRLVGWKGHSLLFRALRMVKERNVDFHLWVVGGGEKEKFEKEARALGIAERVTFTGHRSDAFSFMAGVDIVCLPSEIDYSPYVVLEAMALGKPVLASDVGGLPEMIENGKGGFLLPPKDPEAWTEAIAALAEDGKRRQELGGAARLSVRKKFSLARMVSGFLEIVDADSAVGGA